MFTAVNQGGLSVNLGLLFLLLSGVFSFGWVMGSALGYQNGRRDAEELARLQTMLVESIELDLRQKTKAPAETGVVTQGSLLESV
jgi:lipopolysaccharide biosynthesis regulator YciM